MSALPLQTLESIPELSRYVVLGRLATGGMADVWLARTNGPAGFEKRVVLKTILKAFAEVSEFTDMFLTEARVAAHLNHPNCVQIFDFGLEGTTHYLAMEHIDGFSLSRLLAKAKARGIEVPVNVVLRIIRDAAAGLDYAHDLTEQDGEPLKLVHRDISPDNLLIAFSGQTKVVDFGIAKAADPSASTTRAGTLKGKFSYMAPEYLTHGTADGRADLFALGVVLYYALAGQHPFPGSTDPAKIRSILESEPKPLLELRTGLPHSLEEVVRKALAKNPDERYQTGRELKAALTAAHPENVDYEQVAEFMERLWPKDDHERHRIRTIGSGSSSGPKDRSIAQREANKKTSIRAQASGERPLVVLSEPGSAKTVSDGSIQAAKRLRVGKSLALAVALLIGGGLLLAWWQAQAYVPESSPVQALAPAPSSTSLPSPQENVAAIEAPNTVEPTTAPTLAAPEPTLVTKKILASPKAAPRRRTVTRAQEKHASNASPPVEQTPARPNLRVIEDDPKPEIRPLDD